MWVPQRQPLPLPLPTAVWTPAPKLDSPQAYWFPCRLLRRSAVTHLPYCRASAKVAAAAGHSVSSVRDATCCPSSRTAIAQPTMSSGRAPALMAMRTSSCVCVWVNQGVWIKGAVG